jgi:hypothetical protein
MYTTKLGRAASSHARGTKTRGRIKEDHDVDDVDEKDANAMNGVVYGIEGDV